MVKNIQQQQRDNSTYSFIEPAAPPPPVANTIRTNLIQPTLQKLATMYDDDELDANTIIVDSIIQEASQFITQVTRLYDENEGYAPGLTGLEKSLTKI